MTTNSTSATQDRVASTMQSASNPDVALSVIVVTPESFATIRRTVRHLREQTVQERMELVIVAPSRAALDDRAPHETEGFGRVTIVPLDRPIPNVDKELGHGIRAAHAPVVALIEDHAFPAPDWAAAIIEAHEGPWAGVGSEISNANPHHAISWSSMLIAYGAWLEPAERGEIDQISRHNSTFKRDALVAYGDELDDMMGRDGGLLQDLTDKGHRFYLEPDARIAHVNPSLFSSMAKLRFNAGRLWGAMRAEREGWSLPKRLAYIAGGPLIPLLRFKRIYSDLFQDGKRSHLVPRVLPALMLGLAIDGIGEVVGYAAGPGDSTETLAVFEMDRMKHLTKADQRRLAEPAPASESAVRAG